MNTDTIQIDTELLETALAHARAYWSNLERTTIKDKGTLIGLPHKYIVPSIQPTHGFLYDEMYYWDNLFIIAGLLTDDQTDMARNILRNQAALIDRFGMVPNASRFYMLSRSQPPTLTTQAFMVYEKTNDHDLLTEVMERAKYEYEHVWMSEQHPHNHRVFKDLSRHYDINVLHELAEAESGWDFTPRYNNRCLDYIPIDLNAFLWKYENDFAAYAEIMGSFEDVNYWTEKATERLRTVNKYLWNSTRKFYFDYEYVVGKHSSIYSLAAYVPMFVGMVSKKRAQQLVYRLDLFETDFGLATTPPEDGIYPQKQWASPNGWAPLHYFVVEGLRRYGYEDRARTIAQKWLNTNLHKFHETGQFYEKYNVVDINLDPIEGVYPSQVGFGWTNGVFCAFAREYA